MQKYFESVEDFQKNGSAGDFWVAMDSNPKRLEDEELWVDIYIKPVHPVSYITYTMNLPSEMDVEALKAYAKTLGMEDEPTQGEMDFDDLPPLPPKKFIKINLLKKRKKKEKVPFKDLQDIIDAHR